MPARVRQPPPHHEALDGTLGAGLSIGYPRTFVLL
jgi:hypothetical protein